MSVDLTAAKLHLNLTTDIDNDLVERLLSAAQDWVNKQLGYAIAERFPATVPPALDQAVLMMVGHWYANREATLVGVSAAVLPLGVTDIVNDYRDWSWGDCDE